MTNEDDNDDYEAKTISKHTSNFTQVICYYFILRTPNFVTNCILFLEKKIKFKKNHTTQNGIKLNLKKYLYYGNIVHGSEFFFFFFFFSFQLL